MRHNLIASSFVALAVIGCAGETGPGGGPGRPGKPSEPPAKPVSSCSVTADNALGEGEATSPAIAFGNGRYAVAWTDLTKGAGDVVVSIVGEDGKTLHEQRVATTSAAAMTPSIAALAGGGFLVAWEELGTQGGTVHAVRISEEGKPLHPPFTVATSVSPESHPGVASIGKSPLIAWTEANGAVIGEAEKEKVGATIPIAGGTQVSVAGGADGGAAVWSAGDKLGFSRLGRPLATKPATTFREGAGRANLPRLAAGPDQSFGVVWEDTRGGADKEAVMFTQIDAQDRVGREMPVSPAGGSANLPDIAWIGPRAAITYYQYRDGPSGIYLALVDPKTGLVGKELEIADKGARFPRVVWGGDGKLGVTYAQRKGPAHIAIVTCE